MKILLDSNSLANADKRNHEAEAKLKAKKIAPGQIRVSCSSGEHPHGHLCVFERIPTGDLWGECLVREAADVPVGCLEECPSARGKNVCIHLSAGRRLFLALEWQEANANKAKRAELKERRERDERILGGASRRPISFGPPL